MNIKKLFISISIIIIIASTSAYLTINKMNELSINTQKMYTHPFTVSNAVSDIQTGIITIHRNMKDIVLTKDSFKMLHIIEAIKEEENKVLKNFKLIYKNYLGNKKDIDSSFISFKEWKVIREEVIGLMHQKKVNEAVEITQNKGAKHIENLYIHIKVLKDYAFTKAKQFYTKSIEDNHIDYILKVFIFSMILSLLVVIYIIITLLKVNATNNKQLELIDQNILTAKLGLDKKVIEISNALCKTLEIKKEDMLDSMCENFFTTKDQFKSFESKIYSGEKHRSEIYMVKDNTKIWFNTEIFPEHDKTFNVKYFNILLTNISDKKNIEKIAIFDTLTGLHNRNYFETIFEKEVRRAQRHKEHLSILMFDIDYFKQYNDTYGHQEGDKALQSVAKVIAQNTNRPCDHSFRVGGEEFMILAYHDDIQKLTNFANKILFDLESLEIPHKSSLNSKCLTLSAGVAQFKYGHIYTTKDMYKEVDVLLYNSKNEGRNRITSELIS